MPFAFCRYSRNDVGCFDVVIGSPNGKLSSDRRREGQGEAIGVGEAE
jgi:hypothetical protein